MQDRLFHTTNIKVASALLALGFEWHSEPITRMAYENGRTTDTFWFKASNADGLEASEVFSGMTKGADKLQREMPDHPVAVMHRALMARDSIIQKMRETPRQVVIMQGGKFMALPETASKETREKFIKKMQGHE